MTTTDNTTNDRTGPLTLLLAAEVTEWYETMTPGLRHFLLRTTFLRGEDLEDVLQDAWVNAIRYAAHLNTLSPAHRRNYVLTIVKSVIASRHRRTRRMQNGQTRTVDPEKLAIERAIPLSVFSEPSELVAAPLTASRDWIANAEQMEQTTAARMSLRAVWDAVPTYYRVLLQLMAADYTKAEMAAHLGVSEHTVDTRIWRMRVLLRDVKAKIA